MVGKYFREKPLNINKKSCRKIVTGFFLCDKTDFSEAFSNDIFAYTFGAKFVFYAFNAFLFF
jgi:hypothetical protein